MLGVYNFLKAKFREKNVRVDELVSRSGLSRTTIYRMMKGILIPSPDVRTIIIDLLDLNEAEQLELDSQIKLINLDEDQLRAREKMYEALFLQQMRKEDSPETIVYGEEKYIKRIDEVFSVIIKNSCKPDFICDIKILHCYDEIISDIVFKLISALENLKNLNIEHLVAFYEDSSVENVIAFKAILPLVNYKSYNIRFRSIEFKPEDAALINDLILIRFSYKSSPEQYIVFIPENLGLSDCFISLGRSVYDFFLKKYSSLRSLYVNAIEKAMDMEYYSEAMYENEKDGSFRIFSTPCYDRIPLEVYECMLPRLSENQIAMLINYFLFPAGAKLNEVFTGVFESLRSRSTITSGKTVIEVYTKSGLESFARTGLLSDHLPFIPKFEPTEIEVVLRAMKRLRENSNSQYRMYIVPEDFTVPHVCIVADKLDGIFIEPVRNNDEQLFELSYYCRIIQPKLSQILIDFIENYIPEKLAMKDEAADDFIENLIKKYC